MKIWRINKVLKFENWGQIKALDDFSNPWLKEAVPTTLFKAYYTNDYIFFQFTGYCSAPKVFVKDNNKLEVRFSERVELFFRSNEEMQPYYCLEMDPNCRVLDYKAHMYRKFDRSWSWPDSLEIKTKTEEDKYTLEGKISLDRLRTMNLLKQNVIETGIYRGHCVSLNQKDESIKWISWVKPDAPTPDFHIPSSFGLLVLQ